MTDQSHIFEFVLRPHTALSRRGFFWLMAFVMTVSFGTGIFFSLQGAWPVLGFFGLEVILLYAAFRWSYFVAQRFELVKMDSDRVLVEQVSPRGARQTWTCNPHWLRINLVQAPGASSRREEDEDFGFPEMNQLIFTSHGQQVVVGGFLSPLERQELYDALTQALNRVRYG